MYEIVKKYKDGRVHILLYTPDVEVLPVKLFEIYSTAEYTGLDGITTNYILVKDSDSEELEFVVKKEEQISGGSGSGNVPPTTTIEFATDKEIEDAIQSIINSYEQRGKLIWVMKKQ